MSWDNKNNPWGNGPGGNDNNNDDDIERIIKQSQDKIKKIFPGNKRGGSGGSGEDIPNFDPKLVFISLFIIASILWLASGIYTVDTKEEAIVLRFGEYVRTEKPGINYHLPSPIEKKIKVRVTDIYETTIGSRDFGESRSPRTSNRNNSRNLLMLTGDENIADVSIQIQWKIDNAKKYLFNVNDPDITVKSSAESALREIIGLSKLNTLLSKGREEVQNRTRDKLQEILASYDTGIEIININMSAKPPTNSIRVEDLAMNEDGTMKTTIITTTVDEAFKDVQAAKINKEEIINTAKAFENEIIPQARGQAQKVLQDAEGYKERIIAEAQGNANRFLSIYNEYKNDKEITKRRIYLDTMAGLLDGMDKIILDSDSGVLPYLPLNELKKKKGVN